jgi:hypothetical protein
MTIKHITMQIEPRSLTIKMNSGTIIRGKVNIAEGPITRVSDLFTLRKDPFLVVYDIQAEDVPGNVVIVNKNHIEWVVPED